MQEELNKIIEMAKKKYNLEEVQRKVLDKGYKCLTLYLVIHDDGSEYIQECDDIDLYGLNSASCHIAGDDVQWGGYKAIIKLY